MENPVDSGLAGHDPGGVGDDAIVTAYLDGELEAHARAALEARFAAEPDLRARLDLLRRGDRAFRSAFDALMPIAPTERLQAMLADVQRQSAAVAVSPVRRFGWPRAVAAALAIFAIGALAGYILPMLQPAEPPGWRQVVAEYQTLTTAETLAAIPDNAEFVHEEIAAAANKLELALSPDLLGLPDAALKRAQMFEFRGRPLAQFAYLAPDGPIALCIIRNGRPDAGIEYEEREGSNVVFWTKGGHGYMIIGKAPRETLEAYAGDIFGRIS